LAAVWLRVRIDVVPTNPEGGVSEPETTAANQEAVFNALAKAEQEGFDHDHDATYALGVDYVEVTDFDATA
jgi:hypothetical protein